MKRRRGYAIHLCSFTGSVDDMPRAKQGSVVEVLRVMQADPRKRFSVFEATANDAIARTMTRICQEAYIETDNTCGYPWTKYKLTAKGLAAIGKPGETP